VPAAGDLPPPAAPPASDLDVAADAASEVAFMGADDTPAPTPDMDMALAQMGMLDLDKVTDNPLEVYGFAAFSYVNVVSKDRQVINQFIAKEGSFYVGDLDVYLRKQIADQWRTLIELRFTYAPNGRVLADGTIENNQSYDQSTFGRPVNWGGDNI
jgi:hypothetical protein